MTQEEKSLLLQDLCARLPYGVKCNINGEDIDIGFVGITSEIFPIKTGIGFSLNEDIIKPYLRPMSSMTEEESKRVTELLEPVDKYHYISPNNFSDVIDFFNSIHLDYRGLIEKGLALEAPKGMYEIQN